MQKIRQVMVAVVAMVLVVGCDPDRDHENIDDIGDIEDIDDIELRVAASDPNTDWEVCVSSLVDAINAMNKIKAKAATETDAGKLAEYNAAIAAYQELANDLVAYCVTLSGNQE